MKKRKPPVSRPLMTREIVVDPPALPDGRRYRSPSPILLLGGPIPAGEVLIETQRQEGGRANLVTLAGRRVCNFPPDFLEEIE